MPEPTCPRCQTPITAHGATPCLSAWVAEVPMGWEVGQVHDPRPLDGCLIDDGFWKCGVGQWHPHEDIAAAMEVVEHVGSWFRAEGSPGEKVQVWEVSFDRVRGRADTFPLAICRAAILAALKEARP